MTGPSWEETPLLDWISLPMLYLALDVPFVRRFQHHLPTRARPLRLVQTVRPPNE